MKGMKAVWTNKMLAVAGAAAVLAACSPPQPVWGGGDQSAGSCYLYEQCRSGHAQTRR